MDEYDYNESIDLYEFKIEELKDKLALTEKAFRIAIFELDFAKNHSQSTNSETYERILNLRDKILKQAKEMMKSE
jgi:hypothetical protein